MPHLNHQPLGHPCAKETQNRTVKKIDRRHPKALKEPLCYFIPVLLGMVGRVYDQNVGFVRVHLELVLEYIFAVFFEIFDVFGFDHRAVHGVF